MENPARTSLVAGRAVLAGLFLSWAPGVVLAQEAPADIVGRWLSQLDAYDFITVSHGDISHDADTATTTVSDLEIELSIDPAKFETKSDGASVTAQSVEYRVVLPEIGFTGLALADGYYSASSISAEGMAADAKFEGIGGEDSMSSVTRFSDYRVTNVRWRELPEVADAPDRPASRFYPLAEALVGFSFDDAVIGPLTSVANATGSTESRTTIAYGESRISDAVDGNIGRVSMGSWSMRTHANNPDGGDVDVSMAASPIEARGYNYGTLVRAFAPDAATGDGSYSPILESLEIPGLRISGEKPGQNENFSVNLGRIAVTDVGIRPPSAPILEKLDRMILNASGDAGAKPSDEEIVALVGSIYGALRLGRFEMNDIAFDAAGQAKGKLDSYVVDDLSAAGLGEHSMAGLAISGPGGMSFALGGSMIRHVTFPPLSALLNLEQAQKAGDVDAIMKAIPTVDRISYSGLDVNVPGKAQLALTGALIEMGGHIGAIPTRFRAVLQNLRMPVAGMEEEPRRNLQALGYDDLDVSFALSGAWDGVSQSLNLSGEGELANGGRFAAKAAVGGVPRSLFEDPKSAQAALATLTFNDASLDYEDNSMRDRVLNMVARTQNSDPETVKQMAMGVVPFMLAQLQRPDFSKAVIEAVKTFFEGDGVFHVESRPPAPVPVMQLVVGAQADPGSIVDSLNPVVKAR